MPPLRYIFDNPPLREVVIATYFTPSLDAFQSQHVGRFWDKVVDKFPVVRQQFPIGFDHDINPDEPFPMPRYMFIGHDDATVAQIEKNALQLNWRHRNNGVIPRFRSDIKPAFDSLYAEFETFLRTTVEIPEISIGLCELNYLNVVEQSEYWRDSGDTATIFPALSVPSLVEDAPIARNFNFQFTHDFEDIQLGVMVRNAVSQRDPRQQRLILEIKASGEFDGVYKPDADRWFDKAHDTIFKCLTHITDKRVQEEHWGLQIEDEHSN